MFINYFGVLFQGFYFVKINCMLNGYIVVVKDVILVGFVFGQEYESNVQIGFQDCQRYYF